MFVHGFDCAMALIPYVYLGRHFRSQVFIFAVCVFTFGTMAPESKKRKPDDAALASQGPPTAPVNAMIFQDLLEPAIQYIRDLPQFDDWDFPQPLKVCDDTVDEVGGFMAPFSKQ